jgi:hypothetical protein
MIRARIKQRHLSLPGVFVIEIAHRPIVFNPSYEGPGLRYVPQVIPSAENIAGMAGG